MRILVTGAKGFVGKNLCAQLNNIKDGKARCYGDLNIEEVFEYDLDSLLQNNLTNGATSVISSSTLQESTAQRTPPNLRQEISALLQLCLKR